jgi:hypothetical protein
MKKILILLFVCFTSIGIAQATNLTNLTNSVMNGWRADFQREMSAFIQCTSCSSSVNLTNLTNSVMNGWRVDFQREMGALIQCSVR